MIRVVVVDDHAIVRRGIEALLNAEADIRVVGEAADGRRALELLATPTLVVDVLLLDLSMPRLNGMAVLEEVVRLYPSVHVLMLSMHPEEQHARRMLGSGAAGYVAKSSAEADLVHAVRTVAAGRLFVSRDVGLPTSVDAAPPHRQFTAREYQVFLLVITGQGVSDIAAELDLTLSTVSTHLGKVRTKLGVASNAEVVTYAHRMGLID